MNIGIILAGGIGERMGAGIPKQFIEIYGKPIIVYTIEAFQTHPEVDAIEVVCVKSYMDTMSSLVEKYNLTKVRWICEGGDDYQHSVMNGVYNLDGIAKEDDLVATHFGACPFVSEEIISDSIRVCKEKGNAISTTPFYLLSGIKDNPEYSVTAIDRDTLVIMNSPHTFRYGFIKDLYDEAIGSGIINEVEPHTTTLMQKMGKPIYFSKGSQVNIKITTKEDLDLFKGYLLLKKEGENLI